MFPPKLLIIGAQKSGTTSLAEALASHPEIALGRIKEPDFYTRNWSKGTEWYRDNYNHSDVPWLIDASTAYSGGYIDPATEELYPVPERISATVAGAKLIYILRDPIDRAYSAYWHARRLGRESRSFSPELIYDSNYATQSRYADHLAYFLEYFSSEDLLILDFGKFKTSEDQVLADIAEFLHIQSTGFRKPVTNTVKNKGFEYSPFAKIAMKCFGSEQEFRSAVRNAKAKLPMSLRLLGTKLLTRGLPGISDSDRRKLAAYFEPHTEKLELLTGRSFRHWHRADS